MRNIPSNETQKGMMLLEGLIAILIFSLGILAIVGVQSASIRHVTDAKYRVDASFLANQVVGQMWTNRENLASFVVTDEAVNSLPSGTRTVSVSGTQVTVTVTWKLPGETTTHRHSVIAQING